MMKKKIEKTIVPEFDEEEQEKAFDLESLSTTPLKFHLQTENE